MDLSSLAPPRESRAGRPFARTLARSLPPISSVAEARSGEDAVGFYFQSVRGRSVPCARGAQELRIQAPLGRTTVQGSWRWLRRVQAFVAALADKLARRAR